MKKFFIKILTVVLGFVFILSGAPSVKAQEASDYEFTLEEITVTAQKREENQQKVPIAMEVISGDNLAITGKTNIDDILSDISNVMINNSSDGMKVTIRGLEDNNTPFKDMNVSTPTVAINIDGAYNKSNSAGLNLFDIERVEVLMGPQSTLYANNSPGGIVNVVTAAPKTDKYATSASIEYGNFNLFTGQAMVNAPIVTKKLGMRLAIQQEKRDSYTSDSDETGIDTKSARLKTLYQPNDKLSATITLTWAKRINGGMMGGQVQPFDTEDGHWYTQVNPGSPWVKDGKVTDPWTGVFSSSDGDSSGTPSDGPNEAAQHTKGISGEINWDTGIGTLSIIPQYVSISSDDQSNYTISEGESNTNVGTWTVFTTMRTRQKGLEARMASEEDFFFKWIIGFNWYRDHSSRWSTYNEPDTTPGYYVDTEKSHAFFANVTYPFIDKFRVSAGYRLSWDDYHAIEYPPHVGSGISGQDYSNPDYSLGVEYDLAVNSMLYANYATSYRVNSRAIEEGKTIPAEKLKAFTVGIKNRFIENKLQLNASAYLYNYKNKNAQMTSQGEIDRSYTYYASYVTGPDGVTPYSEILGYDAVLTGNLNADPWRQQYGEFRSIGVDISADWILTSKDRLSLGVSYLNAKWTDLTIEFYWMNWTEAGTAATGNSGAFWSDNGKDFSGVKNTFSPTWTETIGYEHNFMWTYGTLVPHIDIQFKSSYMLDYSPSNYPLDYQESYHIINGNAAFTHASEKWSLNVYLKNATNYAAKNFWMGGDNTMGISDPRTYGAVLSVKF